MQKRGRGNELISFNHASNPQADLNFPDDVLAVAQGDRLHNDVSPENRNLIQNPNLSLLNPYPNQNQEQGLFSFEEALAERMGSVITCVSEEIVNEGVRQRPFSALLENEAEPCCICQEEYVEDDKVGTLDCGHNFHRECIKKWLRHKNICPVCRKPGIRSFLLFLEEYMP